MQFGRRINASATLSVSPSLRATRVLRSASCAMAAWLSYDGAEYAIVPDLRITSTASVAVSKGAIVYR